MNGEYQYSLYGLLIASQHPLPGFRETNPASRPDLYIHTGEPWPDDVKCEVMDELQAYSSAPEQDPVTLKKIYREPDGDIAYYLVLYQDRTVFLLNRDASHIWIDWGEDSTINDVMAYFAGPVLGVALQIRGTVCLHASAIVIDGHAVGLLAPSGTGKSTLAAAFARRGHVVLSDDVVTLYPDDNRYFVWPGYPYLKLWPDSVKGLLGDSAELSPLPGRSDKRSLDLTQPPHRLSGQPAPLAAIYTCTSANVANTPEIASGSASESLLTLLMNTYPNTYYTLGKSVRAREFDVLSDLVQYIPLRFITYRYGMQYLDVLCDSITSDVRQLLLAADTGDPVQFASQAL